MFNLPHPPHFKALDVHAPSTMPRRNLPHLRQDGATYFVTCRLADALPPSVLQALDRMRNELEKEETESIEVIRKIVKAVENNLDAGYGRCWFKSPAYATMLAEALEHFHGIRYFLGSYCVMPNHYHVVLTPFEGWDLSEILRSWNGFSANQIFQTEGSIGHVWQDESYDSIPRDLEHLYKIIQYVGRNPWKAHIPQEQWWRWVAPEWEGLVGSTYSYALSNGQFTETALRTKISQTFSISRA